MAEKTTEAKLYWNGKMAFDAMAGSGFHVPLDAKEDVGGEGQGFRPMELIAVGLAGCTAMDVISILAKKRQQVTGFEIELHADRAEDHPRTFTGALIDYHITGIDVQRAAVERAIELSSVRYCPAQAMLGQVFPITLRYMIYEQDEDGQKQLVERGELTHQDLVARTESKA